MTAKQDGPRCLCDGGAYGVQDHPFLVHRDCPIHSEQRTAEQDGFDPAKVKAAHEAYVGGPDGLYCQKCVLEGRLNASNYAWPCLPYSLAALALGLQGKVARVEAARVPETCMWQKTGIWGYGYSPSAIDAALADQPEQPMQDEGWQPMCRHDGGTLHRVSMACPSADDQPEHG